MAPNQPPRRLRLTGLGWITSVELASVFFCHVERSRDISNHDRPKKSRNTGLETCVAHRLSSLCFVPDFRHRRKRFSTLSHVPPKAFGV